MFILCVMFLAFIVISQMDNKERSIHARMFLKLFFVVGAGTVLFFAWEVALLVFAFRTQGNMHLEHYVWITLIAMGATAAICGGPFVVTNLYKKWYAYEAAKK